MTLPSAGQARAVTELSKLAGLVAWLQRLERIGVHVARLEQLPPGALLEQWQARQTAYRDLGVQVFELFRSDLKTDGIGPFQVE